MLQVSLPYFYWIVLSGSKLIYSLSTMFTFVRKSSLIIDNKLFTAIISKCDLIKQD